MLRKSLNLLVTTRTFKSHRLLSTVAQEEPKPKKQRKKKINEEPKPINKDILKHFDQPERKIAFDFPSAILKKQGKKVSKADPIYIADQLTADKIFEAITKNLPENIPIVETNPGLMLLTNRLIEKPNKLIIFESNQKLFERMTNVVSSYPEKNISLNNNNFLALWKAEFQDKYDNGGRCEMIFKDFPRAKYYNDTVARVFACVGCDSVFKSLVKSVIFQNSYMIPGRSEFFFCLPPSSYTQLTCLPAAGYFFYRPLSVLFQILFEYEFITKVNRKNFLPWLTTVPNTPRKEKFYKYDIDFMYLIRVVPRQNLFEHCQASNLTALWFFIIQHLRNRKKPLIPTMEQWIPGCGPRLIINAKSTNKSHNLFTDQENHFLSEFCSPCLSLSTNEYKENVHVLTQVGSFSPMQIFTVFNQFINWPEYESCAFNSMLEKHLEKVFSNPDESSDPLDVDVEEEEEEEVDSNEGLKPIKN